MKKLLMLLLIVACLLLTACGDNAPEAERAMKDDTAAAEESIETSAAPSDTAAALERGELVTLENGALEVRDEAGLPGLYYCWHDDDPFTGIYDANAQQIVIEPVYEVLGYFSDGLIYAYRDGYWGYLNAHGEKAIGFMYDAAHSFDSGLAEVMVGDHWGVIDTQGNVVVNTEYDKVSVNYPDEGIISCYYDYYGETRMLLLRLDGSQLIDASCLGYVLQNGLLYALQEDEEEKWYYLYTEDGAPVPFSDGAAAATVTLPVNGVSRAKVEKAGRIAGFYSLYGYIDEHGRTLTGTLYSRALDYTPSGKAIIETHVDDVNGHQYFAVIALDGTEVYQLPGPSLGAAWNYYTHLNDYYASAKGRDGMSNIYRYALYCLQTGAWTELSTEPVFVDGTNCIIVQDAGSGLYGLYDGEELVFDYLYSELYYDGTNIIGQRGVETFTHSPTPLTAG